MSMMHGQENMKQISNKYQRNIKQISNKYQTNIKSVLVFIRRPEI